MIYGAGRLFSVASPPLTDGALRVADGKIAAVGPLEDIRRSFPGDGLSLRPDCIIMPGMVNVHTHLEYSAFRHLARPSDFRPWLKRLVAESLLRRRFWPRKYWVESASRGARLALASGTTTVGDIVTFGASPEAALKTGIRMRAFFEVVARSDQTCSGGLAEVRNLLAAKPFSEPTIRPGLAPHSIYTLSRRCLRDAAALAGEEAIPMAVHVAESAAEKELLAGSGPLSDLVERWDLPFRDGRRRSFGSYLQECGLIGPGTLLVHGVHLDEEDIAHARRGGATMAACCRSNDMLRCGSPPLNRWDDEGLPYAYGTDSLASCPDLDLFAEARAAAPLSGADGQETLRRLTLGGAEALSLDETTGSLEAGKDGDFLFVQIDNARNADARDLLGAAAPSVVRTYVRGRRVFP